MGSLLRVVASPVTALVVTILLAVAAAFGIANNKTFGYVLLGLAVVVMVIAVVEWGRGKGWRLQWPVTKAPKPVPLPGGMDFRKEWSLSQHEIQDLKTQLMVWGNDRASRKYMKQVFDMLPLLSVDFAKNVATLLYAAYQKPFTNFAVELKELEDGTATVALPAVNREVNLPREQAIMIQRHLRQIIEDAKNDRTRETGLKP